MHCGASAVRPRLNIPLPDTPDPFDMLIWDAWWQIFWLGVQLC